MARLGPVAHLDPAGAGQKIGKQRHRLAVGRRIEPGIGEEPVESDGLGSQVTVTERDTLGGRT